MKATRLNKIVGLMFASAALYACGNISNKGAELKRSSEKDLGQKEIELTKAKDIKSAIGLVIAGADIYQENNCGRRVLDIVSAKFNTAVLEKVFYDLHGFQEKERALLYALWNNDIETAQAHILDGADVLAQNSRGDSVLYFVISKKFSEHCKTFVCNCKASVYNDEKLGLGEKECNLLDTLMKNKLDNAIKFVRTGEANIYAKNSHGRTVIDIVQAFLGKSIANSLQGTVAGRSTNENRPYRVVKKTVNEEKHEINRGTWGSKTPNAVSQINSCRICRGGNVDFQNRFVQRRTDSPVELPQGKYSLLQWDKNSCFFDSVTQIIDIICKKKGIVLDGGEDMNSVRYNFVQILKKMNESTPRIISKDELNEYRANIRNTAFDNDSRQESVHVFLMSIIKAFNELGQLFEHSVRLEKTFKEEGGTDKCVSFEEKQHVLTCPVKSYNGQNKEFEFNGDNVNDLIQDTKDRQLNTCPEILAIDLCRISGDKRSINFDEKIVLKDTNYQLLGAVCYSGTGRSGHYWAYIHENADRGAIYDDMNLAIRPASLNDEHLRSTATILFYIKSN